MRPLRAGLLLTLTALAAVGLLRHHGPGPLPAPRPPADSRSATADLTAVGGRPVAPATLPDGQPGKAIASEVLVKIPVAERAAELQARPSGLPEIYFLPVASGQNPDQAVAAAAAVAGVVAASPDYVVTKTATPNDTFYASHQWNLPKISAPAAWDRSTGSSNTILATLDTGVNWNHQDLSSKAWTNAGETAGNGIDDDANGYVDDHRGMDFVAATFGGGVYTNDADGPMDDEGHGSLVSSVMAAATNNGVGVAAVNWQARIMPVKVLDTKGNGSLSDVAAGIRYAAANGAKVINMSLGAFGLGSDFATDAAIDYAVAQGTTLVAASGNDGSPSTISYPAINAKVMAIGATDQSDNRPGYSNAGPQLSVAAPGNSIPGVKAVVNPPAIPSLSLQSGSSSLAAGSYRYSLTAISASGETIALEPDGNENRITVGSGQRVVLSWSSVFGATGYKVYRTAVGGAEGSQTLLATLGSVTTYTDDGSVTPGGSQPPETTTATLVSSYELATGTSLATPHVAGLAGLILGLNSSLTPAQVRGYIEGAADKVPAMAGANRTNQHGYGRINAQRTLAAFPPYSAQWAGQSGYPSGGSGDQQTVYIDYKNVGTEAWSSGGANPIRLGTGRPRDRFSPFRAAGWLAPNRPATFSGRVSGGTVTPTSTINPGETARFQFTVTIPPGAQGVVREYFQPVVEGIGWLEDHGVFLDVTTQLKSYAYTFAGQTYPPGVMQPGSRSSVSIDLTNSGQATWRRSGQNPLRMGTSHPRDRGSGFANETWAGSTRLGNFAGKVAGGAVTDSDSIAPGETARFNFDVTAPSRPGFYREHFSPLLEGYQWLADIGIQFETFVPDLAAPDYNYQPVSQSPYPVIEKGGTAPMNIRLRNTGRQNWVSSGANAVKLGTSRPMDRGSGFNTPGGGWLSHTRIHLSSNITDPSKNIAGETTIAPGEVGEFAFTITGNPAPGTYREYFQPVVEGVTWMRDAAISWDITVRRPIQVGIAAQSSATLNSNGNTVIRNEIGQTFGNLPPGSDITISVGAGYTVSSAAGTYTTGSPLHVDQDPGSVLTVAALAENGTHNRFRGNLYLKNTNVGTYLINDVNLEEYLKGGGEVPDAWPAEAIRAQTVAARTYAARKLNSPSSDGFHLYDDTRDQVYNGFVAEQQKPNTSAAVDATRGVGIFYGGSLIQAFYSSDTGGSSEANENVWGGTAIPYLRNVGDPYQRPDNWAKTVSNATLQANFGASGNIDTINILEYYPSGRVKTVRLSGGWGSVTRTFVADTMRAKLTTRSSVVTALGRSGNDWVISGRGFGHGIGMGQWGAYNQANAGRTYQQILQFYYTGIGFGSVY